MRRAFESVAVMTMLVVPVLYCWVEEVRLKAGASARATGGAQA